MNVKNGTHSLKNRPAWMRGLDIVLRTGHVAVAGILFGGFVFGLPFFDLVVWHNLTIATGIGLLALELRHSLSWPHQGRGVMGGLHIGLTGMIHLRPELAVPILWAVTVLGSVGSHMPRSYRHWSVIYRKVVD